MKINDDVEVDEYELNSEESQNSSENNIISEGKKMFALEIPYDKYIEMKPTTVQYKDYCSIRSYNVLKKNTWSDIVNDVFFA